MPLHQLDGDDILTEAVPDAIGALGPRPDDDIDPPGAGVDVHGPIERDPWTPANRGLERVGLGAAVGVVALHAIFRIDAAGLWLDEAYTLAAANDLRTSLAETHGTMGFYYALLSLWASVSTATWWLRLLSVLFAVGALFVLRPVARRIGGSAFAAIALPLAALGPMFEVRATEARSYPLVTLLVCSGWYVLLRALDAPRPSTSRSWFLALTPIAIVGVLSHGLFVLHLVPMGLVALLAPRPWRSARWLVPAGLAAGGLTLVLYLAGGDRVGTTVIGGVADLVRATFVAYLPSSAGLRLLLFAMLSIGLVAAVRAATRTSDRRERAVALVPVAWVVVPCAVLMAGTVLEPRYNPRYLAPIGVGIALLVARGATTLDQTLSRRSSSATSPVPSTLGKVSLATLLVACAGLITTPPLIDHDWRSAATVVAAEARPSDGMIFANLSLAEPAQHRAPFEAAWREVGNDRPPGVVSPPRPLGEVRRVDPVLPLAEMVDGARGHDRIWVVEQQHAGLDLTSRIVDELDGLGFRQVDRWTFSPDISVVLLTMTY